jgi:hypothetical protein
MKKYILFGVLALLTGPLFAADTSPKDDVINAAKKLADKNNYSWETTVTNVNGNGFRFGPTEGKIEKDGTTWFSMMMNDDTTEVVMQGGKTAVKTPDNGWQSQAEATEGSDQPGPAMFLARLLQNFKAPPAQAEDLAANAKEIKKDGDAYASDLTENGAKDLLSWRRSNDNNGPTVSNAKGSVKFWVKDGVLTKYEFNLQGSVSFNGNDFDVNRTTTVEFKDVGSTKITVPAEAEKKLSS